MVVGVTPTSLAVFGATCPVVLPDPPLVPPPVVTVPPALCETWGSGAVVAPVVVPCCTGPVLTVVVVTKALSPSRVPHAGSTSSTPTVSARPGLPTAPSVAQEGAVPGAPTHRRYLEGCGTEQWCTFGFTP